MIYELNVITLNPNMIVAEALYDIKLKSTLLLQKILISFKRHPKIQIKSIQETLISTI